MVESWKTTRRCHDCLEKGNTTYLMAQAWGKNEQGQQLYKLDCPDPSCGYHDGVTTWNGGL